MSNSPLVDYTRISPNKNSPRNHKIDTITIHCVVGQCTAETLGNIFAPTSRQASSNYGVGTDGKIGMYVEEKDRSWCSSNAANDNRAVTIEVASDTKHPYAVNDRAFAALLDLVTDICKRNGIKKLVWSTKKADRVNHKNGCNMTVHRDYANKSCPGDYLYNRHGEIAAEVNRRLGVADTAPDAGAAQGVTVYTVKKGDTLGFITTNYYGSNAQRNALYKANAEAFKATSGKLVEGMTLVIPETLGGVKRIAAPVLAEGESLYTVQAGDTLSKIAQSVYGDMWQYKAIFERNSDRLKNANTIYEGQVIVLPAK